MSQISILRLLVLMLIVSTSGCRYRSQIECAQIDTSIADLKPAIDHSQIKGEISYSFEAISDLKSSPEFSLNQFLNGDSVALDLKQCCCIAAINSPLADVIDKERKASCCTIGFNKCLDRFLDGQATQQRNKAAANAGELFLRLVEIHLQKQLVGESIERLEELRDASAYAAKQGFATAEPDKELDANEIDLHQKLLKIEKNRYELTLKLSAILGLQNDCQKIIEPIFELLPVYEKISANDEIRTALNQRADLAGFSSNCGCVDPECFAILSQLDPRLGIGLVAKLKRCVLLQRLLNRTDPAQHIRKQQIQKLRNARQDLVRIQVNEAVIDIESGYRELVLEQEDLKRLQNRMEALEAAAEFDAMNSYVESVQNWVEQQSVKSNRISTAIEFEIAKVKLLEATGQWTSICGLDGMPHSVCSCCDSN